MSKQGKWILAAVLALLALCAVLLLLNRPDGALMQAQQDRTLLFVSGGQTKTLTESQLRALPYVEFQTAIKSSGKSAQPVRYGGVMLSDVLDYLGVDCPPSARVYCTGIDGYVAVLTREEAYAEANAYIAYTLDGQPMKPLSEGGYGPYQLVLRRDDFSQRWCKYLVKIEIK